MARENAADKARRYLGEGRVIVTAVGRDHAAAAVRGDGHRWRVTYNAGRWSCDCTARTDRCSHATAVRLVVAVDLDDHTATEAEEVGVHPLPRGRRAPVRLDAEVPCNAPRRVSR